MLRPKDGSERPKLTTVVRIHYGAQARGGSRLSGQDSLKYAGTIPDAERGG